MCHHDFVWKRLRQTLLRRRYRHACRIFANVAVPLIRRHNLNAARVAFRPLRHVSIQSDALHQLVLRLYFRLCAYFVARFTPVSYFFEPLSVHPTGYCRAFSICCRGTICYYLYHSDVRRAFVCRCYDHEAVLFCTC